MSTFAILKTQVESAMIRSDLPDYIYSAANSQINGMRLLEMQATSTLSVSGESTALPSDFMAMESAYVDADPRRPLLPSDEHANNSAYEASGYPTHYAIVDGALLVNPSPDGTYSVVMRYYARLADFSGDSDTNDVLTTYPTLYLYASLVHAAVWAADMKRLQVYQAAWTLERERVERQDILGRSGQGLVMQAERSI